MPISATDIAFSNAMSAMDEARKMKQEIDDLKARLGMLESIVRELIETVAHPLPSGDRTEPAPRSPVVEPSLWDPEAEKAASEAASENSRSETGES